MGRKRVWSGRHNKWVFASNRYLCPICKMTWGGGEDPDNEPITGERVCNGHELEQFKHLPKKVWPRWAK